MDAEPLQKKLHQYYDQLPGGVCLLRQDRDEQILFVNSELLSLYQCTNEEEFYHMTGGKFSGMMEREDYVSLRTRMNSRHGEQSIPYVYLTFHYYTLKGYSCYVEAACREAELTELGKVWLLTVFNREGREVNGELDSVTGLLNMHAFYQRIQEMAAGRTEESSAYGAVYLNLTNFKLFNEMHGIYEGDRLLKSMAGILKREFGSSFLSRLFGDNFVMFVPRAGLEAKIETLCHKVNHLINKPSIMMKAGICLLTGEEQASSSLISTSFDMAKLACDSIKRDATRCYAIYHEDMRREVVDRAYIIDNIDRAIRDGQIKVYLQPVVRTFTGKLCGYEALARWESPGRGIFSPGVFIPVLEDTRLIYKLDTYMLQEVGRLLRYQLQNNLPMVPISVNLSRCDFLLMDPLAVVEEVIARFHIPRYYLRLEVTESALVQEHDILVKKLRQFREAGYQVWLDDFGSAYSSLNVLQRYHFDELKIDQGLLRDFNEESRKIIRSIVLMAKMLGIHVLAEGVETKEQVEFLRKIGCEKIQGFYYGRPLPYEACTEHCRNIPLRAETIEEEHAYDILGMVNLITDMPVALLCYDGKRVEILSENEAYQHVVAVNAGNGTHEVHDRMDVRSSFWKKCQAFLGKVAASGQEENMTYVDNGQYFKLRVQKVASLDHQILCRAHIYNITYDQDMASFRQYDDIFRNLMLIYDGVYFFDMARGELQVIESMNALLHAGQRVREIPKLVRHYAKRYVHPEDRSRFLAFLEPQSLLRKASNSGRLEVIGMFRIRKPDGSYKWMIFDAVAIHLQGVHDVLLCVREDIWERQGDLYALLPKFVESLGVTVRDDEAGQSELPALWQSVLDFAPEPVFWKDAQRRYRGVNQAFLSYFGIQDASVILGKTDEDFGWDVRPDKILAADNQVLQQGKSYHRLLMTSLFKGVPRRIAVTGFPVYADRKITGILGYFVDCSNANHDLEEKKLGIMDRDTGLFGFRGMLMTGLEYEDHYRQSGAEYTACLLHVQEMNWIVKHYGQEIRRKVLQAVRDRILECNPLSGVVTHIGNGFFCCFGRTVYVKDIEGCMAYLSKQIHEITTVDGHSCTLSFCWSQVRSAETHDFDELMMLLFDRLHDQEQLYRGHGAGMKKPVVFEQEKFDAWQERVFMSDIETYDLLYLNNAMRKALNLPDDYSLLGKKCYEVMTGSNAPCHDCTNHLLCREKFYTWTHRFGNDGSIVLQHDTLVPWQGRNVRFSASVDLHAYLDYEAEKKNLLLREEIINDIIALGMEERNPEEGIRKMLAKIGETLQAERVLIFEERDGDIVSGTYEWRRDTLPSLLPELQEIPRAQLQPLYDHFQHHHMLILNDTGLFLQNNPGFQPVLQNVRSLVSGHLLQSGRSLGFTEVINPASASFASATFLLSSLTSFLAIMLRNRDTIKRLEELGNIDQLTGVCNRRALLSYIHGLPPGLSFAFIFGDINGLKKENDTKGHEAGDSLIRRAAAVLTEVVGADHVFRMGGDEFLLLVPHVNEKQAAAILRDIRHRYEVEGIGIALGCVVRTSPFADIDAIISETDHKMYQNKNTMRQRCGHARARQRMMFLD